MTEFIRELTKEELKKRDELLEEREAFDNLQRYKNDILPYIPKKK